MVHVPHSLLRLASLFSNSKHRADTVTTSPATVGASDSCASLFSSGPIATVSAVEACYNSFPATVTQKQTHMSVLKLFFSMYPYTELAQNSLIHKGHIYPMKLNFLDELDQISADPKIDTEYKMTQAILDLVAKLEDGHVTYTPLCFQPYLFLQPFNLLPVYQNDGSIDIVIESAASEQSADLLSSYWKDALQGRDGASLIGAKVVSLDGKDPVDFIQDVADRVGGQGHSPELRFNLQFQSYKGPTKQPSSFTMRSRSPRIDSLVYALQLKDGSSVTLTFPWAAWSPTDLSKYTSGKAWYDATCSQAAAVTQMTGSPESAEGAETAAPGSNATETVQFKSMKPILNDQDSFFYMMEDGVTGVFAHTTFMPTSPEPAKEAEVTRSWVETIARGLQALENAGAKRLIIDLSGNGGGRVAYGWQLMNYLFPNAGIKPLEYTFPLTPEIVKAFQSVEPLALYGNMTAASAQFGGYRNLKGDTIKPESLMKELAEPGTKLMKGLSTPFTNHFLMDFDLELKQNNESVFNDFGKLKHGWDPKNVVLLSNGQCGSTCAQFTTILRDQVKVKAVTYGGGKKRSNQNTRAFDGTSFAAGFILSFKQVLGILMSAKMESLIDSPFMVSLDSQITFGTSFSRAGKLPDVPIEWVIDTSDQWLSSKDLALNNAESVYKVLLDSNIFSSESGSTKKAFRKAKKPIAHALPPYHAAHSRDAK
ncbi:hypothetical protein BC830DRAFT_1078763 [Chytriomyces sp. MP71]|nr:hypothetical protein BC830DRAFT_1078763 [Chytriomyces sp. MP71]